MSTTREEKCRRMVQDQVFVFDCFFKVFPRYMELQASMDWADDDSRAIDWSIPFMDCCNLGREARAGLGRDDLAWLGPFSLLLRHFKLGN